MTVIQFPPRPPSEPEARAPDLPPSIPISGTFRAPSGRRGTMTGSLRLEHVRLASEQSWADAVFTGELFDDDGQRLGSCSRRQSAPVQVGDSDGAPITVGPVVVDLMGLAVAVPAVCGPSWCVPDRAGPEKATRRHTGESLFTCPTQWGQGGCPGNTTGIPLVSHPRLSEEMS
jgi:hypothetical protein